MTLEVVSVYVVFIGGAALATSFLSTAFVSSAPPRLHRPNYRSVPVPVVLGSAVWTCVLLMVASEAAGEGLGPLTSWGTWAVPLGGTLVYVAGVLDDLFASDARGLRGHLRMAGAGRLTTGLVKVVVIVAGSVLVVVVEPRGSGLHQIVGVVAIAACANLWNGLDVAPGRAGKAYLIAGTAIASAPPQPRAPVLLASLGASAAALWFDLRERGMLGDAGANVLGFLVGSMLYLQLSTSQLVAAAVVSVALNLVAETFTLSRLITAVPPLRWVDDLGRRPEWRARRGSSIPAEAIPGAASATGGAPAEGANGHISPR